MALSLQGILERVLGTRMTKAFTEGAAAAAKQLKH